MKNTHSPTVLTARESEVLTGILLGDAHLETTTNNTFRLKIEQSINKEPYIRELFEIFYPFGTPGVEPTEVKYGVSHNWKYQTNFLEVFKPHAAAFYGLTGKGKKQVPKDIQSRLTATAIAYWYMDDGGIKDKDNWGMFLNTQGFTLADNEILCAVLKSKFNIQSKPVKAFETNEETKIVNELYRIYVSAKSYETIRSLIFPLLNPCLHYKFPPTRPIKTPKPMKKRL